jgi:hypothetical protein
MRKDMHTTIAWIGFALGLFLITLQATQTIPLRMAEGGGIFRALVFFFSFFTILTNLGVTLVYFAVASGSPRVRFLAGPTARAMMAGSIFVVMVIYAALLQSAWNPQGLMKLSDIGLHYVAPILFLVWWAIGPHPVRLRWGRVGVMMLYPVIYLVWVVIRGISIGRWPYPFVSVPDLGWGQVLVNMVAMAVLFVVVFLGAIALSRALNARSRYGLLPR